MADGTRTATVVNLSVSATDNVAVAGVYCSLSNAIVNTGFAMATTTNNWANWSTNVVLVPGTNTIRAYAVDTSGNISATNSVNIVYILSATLTVKTTGDRKYEKEVLLPAAIAGGLKTPLVYNPGGYDAVETLRLLDGVVDIYMPDFKFWDPQVAGDFCSAEDYPEIARQAV